jgi:Icc-related predicted phosphoesterase
MVTKFSVISDLHLEFGDLELPGGEVLIVAGDACEANRIKPGYDANSSERYARFFHEECAKYDRVIYVMGNHEHYHGRFDKTYNYLKEVLPKNVELLEKAYTEVNDILVIGATLWTDLNDGDPITAMTVKSGMNDYKVIHNYYEPKGLYYKLTPEVTKEDHQKAKQFISDTVEQFQDRQVVVVTHHSPSRLSTATMYQHDFHLNGGYSSTMENFILDRPNIKFWIHGHTHDRFRYELGQCTVICNPRGYVGYESQTKTFDTTTGFVL